MHYTLQPVVSVFKLFQGHKERLRGKKINRNSSTIWSFLRSKSADHQKQPSIIICFLNKIDMSLSRSRVIISQTYDKITVIEWKHSTSWFASNITEVCNKIANNPPLCLRVAQVFSTWWKGGGRKEGRRRKIWRKKSHLILQKFALYEKKYWDKNKLYVPCFLMEENSFIPKIEMKIWWQQRNSHYFWRTLLISWTFGTSQFEDNNSIAWRCYWLAFCCIFKSSATGEKVFMFSS